MKYNKNQIEIKSHFTDWHKVNKEIAKSYIVFLMRNITQIPYEERIQYIKEHYLKGISIKELFVEN